MINLYCPDYPVLIKYEVCINENVLIVKIQKLPCRLIMLVNYFDSV